MIIDFKEISPGNKGGENQDEFELFGRDFLEAIGYEIIRHPDRGPDGKKDMIVRGKGNGKKKIDWLVSCKHNANSKTSKSVNDTDEPNIIERLTANNCQGFIGVYSTIQSSSLSNLLFGCKEKFQSEIYDHKRIEKLILENKNRHQLFWRYFTNSYEKHKHNLIDSQKIKIMNSNQKQLSNLTEDDILNITKTAIIIIEIEKIKSKFFNSEWDVRENVLTEINIYSELSTIRISETVLSFLKDITEHTRSGMTSNIAISIFSLSLEFFPYFEDVQKDKKKFIQLAEECINMAFNMVYDASIYLMNYEIIMYGLTILKFIYKKGKDNKSTLLISKVNDMYQEIESNLNRPERDDLDDVIELVKIFKADIDKGTLSFPPVSEKLYKKIYQNKSIN